MGADAGRVPPICERPGDLFRISQLLSRTGLDAAAARPGRIAAIAMVPGCNASSADGGQVHGDDSTDRLRSCLRPGALYRRMDRGNRCSRPVRGRDYAAEAALLQAVARNAKCREGGAIADTAHLSTRAAADALNRRGIRTASGKQWYAMQVLRARHRLGL